MAGETDRKKRQAEALRFAFSEIDKIAPKTKAPEPDEAESEPQKAEAEPPIPAPAAAPPAPEPEPPHVPPSAETLPDPYEDLPEDIQERIAEVKVLGLSDINFSAAKKWLAEMLYPYFESKGQDPRRQINRIIDDLNADRKKRREDRTVGDVKRATLMSKMEESEEELVRQSRREETKTQAPEKTPREVLEEARSAYVGVYKQYHKSGTQRLNALQKILGIFKTRDISKENLEPDKAELLQGELDNAKRVYDRAKSSYAEQSHDGQKRKLEESLAAGEMPRDFIGSEAEYRDGELARIRLELFREVILQEHEALHQAQAETWPPKDKSVFRKAGEWWMRRGKYTRLAISSAAMTGLFAVTATGAAAGLTGAAWFLGSRLARGGISMLAGQAMGRGVEALDKRYGVLAKKEKAMEKLRSGFTFENMQEVAKEYERLAEYFGKLERRKNIEKGLLMLATGAGATAGLNWFFGVPVAPRFDELPRSEAPGEVPDIDELRKSLSEDFPKSAAVDFDEEPLAFPSEILREGGAPRVSEISPQDLEEIERITKVRPGEGFWQPIYRKLEQHLMNDPDGFAEQYKWGYTFDRELLRTDPEYAKDILNRQTQHLLLENKKILNGGEMRLTKPGVHVILKDNGEISVFEGEEGNTMWKGKPIVSDITPPSPKPLISEAPQTAYRPMGDTRPSTQFEPGPRVEYPINTRGGGMSENILDYGKPAAAPTPDRWAEIGAMGERTGIYTEAAPKVPGPEFVFSEFAKKYLDHFAEYKRSFSDAMLVDLAHKMRGGRITTENFWTYYQNRMGVTAMRRSVFDQMVNEMKANVGKILEGSVEEKGSALTYLRAYVEAMRGKK